ncbi:MAG: hypothetical protein M1834_005745 [Cirrosporium novae-zelandiae]|nr:MAG: hypothetical protein M1834_005745 [Cirrosporium novae-zelandiae]
MSEKKPKAAARSNPTAIYISSSGSPIPFRSPIDLESPIASGSSIPFRSPMASGSPISFRSPMDLESPMASGSSIPFRNLIPFRSPIPSGSPIDLESPINSRSPIASESPIDLESPINSESPIDLESLINSGSPIASESPIDLDSPINSGSPIASESPIDLDSPMTSRNPIASGVSAATPAEPSLPNYLLRVTLRGSRNPEIYRILSIPNGWNFHQLHQAIQLSFGWTMAYRYVIDIIDYFTLEEERGVDLEISTLDQCLPTSDWPQRVLKSQKVNISVIFGSKEYAHKDIEIDYLYDLGDKWSHDVEMIGQGYESANKAFCVAGEGHGPVEDAGGIEGWEIIKKVYAVNNPSLDDAALREWVEKDAPNRDPNGLGGAGPWIWDIEKVNRQLVNLPQIPSEVDPLKDRRHSRG